MEFRRIQLTNWRNFSQVDVRLQNRAFLIGANASGKSNFLDAFRFLRELVIPGGGFQQAVLNRGGVKSLRHINARYPSHIALDVEMESSEAVIWRYRLAFSQETRGHRDTLVRQEKIWRNAELILNRPETEDTGDPVRLRQTYLEQTFVNRDFRPIADLFSEITYIHIVPQLIRDPERATGRQNDPFGEDFLEQIATVNQKTRDARLRRIQEALKITIPQLLALQWFRDEKGTAHLRGRYENWRPRGVWQQETEFSDGTLRLIGLLWALQTGEGPLLLEEPELSLHTAVVRHLPGLMQGILRSRKTKRRQILVSTHSRDLLNDPGIAPDEVLLFMVNEEGTQVTRAIDDEALRQEFGIGFTAAEAAMPATDPPVAQRLSDWKT